MTERFSSPEENQENNRQKHIEWAQSRAMRYLNKGKLKEAIDSMIYDIDEYNGPGMNEEAQIRMEGKGLALRDDPSLSAERVLEWITNGLELPEHIKPIKPTSSHKVKPIPKASEFESSKDNSKKEYRPKTDEDFEKYAKSWLDKFSGYRGEQLERTMDDLRAWSGSESVNRERFLNSNDTFDENVAIRNKYYPGWTKADFKKLLTELKKILKLEEQ